MKRRGGGALVALLLIGGAIYLMTRSMPLLRHPVVLYRLMTADAPSRVRVPVAGVQRRQLRDTWGAARSGGRTHQGIDIFAPRGRAIVSATDGIVVTIGENELGGRIVRVLGPGGYWHYYAHLERFADFREGDVVRAGSVIGYVGDSGNARGTPPHLHYGVYRPRGGAINPYPLLK